MSAAIRFSIAPVRSLGLQHPDFIDVTATGVVEDRRFYLIDDHDFLVDRIIVGELVQVSSQTNAAADWLRLDLPDGRVVEDAVELGDAIESPIHGRTAVGHVVVGPWAEALEGIAGRRVRLVRTDRPGGTRIGNPASLVTRGSIDELARQVGAPSVDARRFRMLIELDGTEPHAEDAWLGHRIAIGGAILRVTERDARCAITTQDPDSGHRDLDTLRTIIRYRGLMPDAHGAPKAMFGVLAAVEQPGRISLGDEVAVLD
ncbi:MAG: MOSC domain-containing protein [Candidatus Limnocylindrales bacterium]